MQTLKDGFGVQAPATPGSPLQVFQLSNTFGREQYEEVGMRVLQSGTSSNTVICCSETARIMPWCSPLKQRDNASKQLSETTEFESTPRNNNNYNNYMFIYTIYTQKRHAVAFLKIMKNLQQCIKIKVEFKIALFSNLIGLFCR